jgi:hypothetical protein
MGLARQAIRLPLTALSIGLDAWERSRDLREFALRRGNEALQFAERRGGEALQIVAHTPLGRLLPKTVFDDDADAEAERIMSLVHERPPEPWPAERQPVQSRADQHVESQRREAEPSATPTPTDAEPARTPGPIAVKAEHVAEQLAVPVPEDRTELPIQDFDNISLGSLRARLRSLSVEDLVVLREWEQAHANRLPVLTTLANRIAKLG